MPGASHVRFVTLAALIVSVALALWLLDVHRAWIAVGVVVAWLAVPLIEWNASRRFRAPRRPGRPPGGRRPAAAPPADEPKTRAFRLFGLCATLRAAPKKATTFDPPPTLRGPAASEPAPGPTGPTPAEPGRRPPTSRVPASSSAALPPVGHRRHVARLHDQGRDGPAASSTEPVVRSFLLLYRRRFAAPDGLQPVEFDGLVPRSLPSLIAELEEA